MLTCIVRGSHYTSPNWTRTIIKKKKLFHSVVKKTRLTCFCLKYGTQFLDGENQNFPQKQSPWSGITHFQADTKMIYGQYSMHSPFISFYHHVIFPMWSFYVYLYYFVYNYLYIVVYVIIYMYFLLATRHRIKITMLQPCQAMLTGVATRAVLLHIGDGWCEDRILYPKLLVLYHVPH